MTTFWFTILILGATGLLAAIVLYIVAKKFHVYEDPRIALIEEHLPGANCGGCGYKGCHDFAMACAGATSLTGFNCPGAGQKGMEAIASLLGLTASAGQRKVALLACDGACSLRKTTSHFSGPRSCTIQASIFSGTSDCPYGCLGCGDCVAACPHGAMSMDEESGLPVVDIDKCTGCGVCVKTCPRSIMKLVVVPEGNPSIVRVACSNHDRGPAAMKACDVSCIACGKCKRTCAHDAITIDNLCASIDSEKCVGCGECVEVCPRHSIISLPVSENNS